MLFSGTSGIYVRAAWNRAKSRRGVGRSGLMVRFKRTSQSFVRCILCRSVTAFWPDFATWQRFLTSGLRSRPARGAGMVSQVHTVRQRQRPQPSLGSLLSRVQTHFEATPTGLRSACEFLTYDWLVWFFGQTIFSQFSSQKCVVTCFRSTFATQTDR